VTPLSSDVVKERNVVADPNTSRRMKSLKVNNHRMIACHGGEEIQ
jgi:hypothetical protein